MDQEWKLNSKRRELILNNLNQLRDEVHQINVANGWHNEKRDFIDDVNLIHSEISEAYEDYRAGKAINEIWYEYKVAGKVEVSNEKQIKTLGDQFELGKPCGIPSELADIVIRILDTDKLHELHVVENYENLYKEQEPIVQFTFSELIYTLHYSPFDQNDSDSENLAFMISVIENFCNENSINLEQIITEKLEYNKTRGYRHGGKVI